MMLTDAVVVDISPHPQVSYAVVVRGQLLPIRFLTEDDAYQHLGQIAEAEFDAGHPDRLAGCPRCGKSRAEAMETCQEPTCPLPIPGRAAA